MPVHKKRAIDIWKEMKPSSLRRLALAVFLTFGAVGPITILMESSLRLVPWTFVIAQTASLGGFAASIALFARRRWWITTAIVLFWTFVITLNSGGLTLTIGEGGMRANLGTGVGIQDEPNTKRSLVFRPDQLDAIYTQRGILGSLSMLLIAVGYIMFIRVVRKEAGERARFETEVNIAQDIQHSLLPPSTFALSWVSGAGMTIPTSEVGGDFFDIIQLHDDQLVLAVADVTGHGVGAGILSAMAKSALHTEVVHNPSPTYILQNLNRTVYDLSKDQMFVTFAYLFIDRRSHQMYYATAGHPAVFLKRSTADTIESLRTANIGLGLKSEFPFSSGQASFQSGDRLLLYTDGVIEAMNKAGDQFGAQRLMTCLSGPEDSPLAICRDIQNSVKEFTGSDAFQDDITLLAGVFS